MKRRAFFFLFAAIPASLRFLFGAKSTTEKPHITFTWDTTALQRQLDQMKSALEPARAPILINFPPLIFDLQEVRPISNLPAGAKVRLRMRPDEFATAYVRSGGSTIGYHLEEFAGQWRLCLPFSANSRT